MEIPVENNWKVGRNECLYLVSDYALELTRQYVFECENEIKAGKSSNLKTKLKNQIDVLEVIKANIKKLKPGSFIDEHYSPFVEGLNNIKK